MPKIVVLRGKDSGKVFDLGRSSIVGRSPKAHVVLSDPRVSRWHFQIVKKGEGHELRHFFGSAPTTVNEEAGAEIVSIRHGDTIAVGESLLLFSEDDALDMPDTLDSEELKAIGSSTVYRLAQDAALSAQQLLSDRSDRGQSQIETLLRFEQIVGALDEDRSIHDVVLDFIFGNFEADRASIILHESARGSYRVVARRFRGERDDKAVSLPSRAILSEITRTQDSLLLEDASADTRFADRYSVIGQHVRAVMGVPMVFRNELIGAVMVESLTSQGAFAREDLHLLGALGAHSAIALERARLAEEVQEKVVLENELQLAGAIQQSVLPDAPPQRTDVEVNGIMLPAREVGGDYYDLVERGEELFFTVGDVTGKGVNAGLVMMMARTYFRSLLELVEEPEEIMSRLNNYLVRDTEAHYFMTFSLGRWRPGEKEVDFYSAGHEYPLHWSSKDELAALVEVSGIALGIRNLTAADVKKTTIPLAEGDVVLLYSDGVTEARNRERDMYGRERLQRVFSESAGRHLHAVVGAVVDDVRAFSESQPQADDLTVVALKRLSG